MLETARADVVLTVYWFLQNGAGNTFTDMDILGLAALRNGTWIPAMVNSVSILSIRALHRSISARGRGHRGWRFRYRRCWHSWRDSTIRQTL